MNVIISHGVQLLTVEDFVRSLWKARTFVFQGSEVDSAMLKKLGILCFA